MRRTKEREKALVFLRCVQQFSEFLAYFQATYSTFTPLIYVYSGSSCLQTWYVATYSTDIPPLLFIINHEVSPTVEVQSEHKLSKTV